MLNVKAAAKNMLEELQGRAFGELKTSHEEKILMKRHELENSMYILDLEALFDHLGSPSALGSLGHDTDLCVAPARFCDCLPDPASTAGREGTELLAPLMAAAPSRSWRSEAVGTGQVLTLSLGLGVLPCEMDPVGCGDRRRMGPPRHWRPRKEPGMSPSEGKAVSFVVCLIYYCLTSSDTDIPHRACGPRPW